MFKNNRFGMRTLVQKMPQMAYSLQATRRNNMVRLLMRARKRFAPPAAEEIVEFCQLGAGAATRSTACQELFRDQGLLALLLLQLCWFA